MLVWWRNIWVNRNFVDFQVTRARRLEEATEKVGSTEYDVILLDLGLPGVSGLETFSDMFFFSGDVP